VSVLRVAPTAAGHSASGGEGSDLVFDLDHDIARAYTVPVPPATASTLGVQWALQQAKALDEPVSLYAPGSRTCATLSPATVPCTR